MKRSAKAVWKGTVKEGSGVLTTQSTTLNDTQYSFKSRFEEGVGTNPEELLAAAHAGCFTMKTSALLSEAGFTPESLETDCKISFARPSAWAWTVSTKILTPPACHTPTFLAGATTRSVIAISWR